MAVSPVCGESDFTINNTASQPLTLWNEGAFTTVHSEALSRATGGGNPMATADVDGDGNLDIYVGLNGGPNQLFRWA